MFQGSLECEGEGGEAHEGFTTKTRSAQRRTKKIRLVGLRDHLRAVDRRERFNSLQFDNHEAVHEKVETFDLSAF